MKLSDLRRVTVRKNLRIRFPLSTGMECVLNEHGIAQVPALRAAPAFNLEEELAAAREFVVEPVCATEKDKARQKPRSYTRDEMIALATAPAGGPAGHDEHED
jgi:hypothetical protein